MLRQFQGYSECSMPPLHDGKADHGEAMASWWKRQGGQRGRHAGAARARVWQSCQGAKKQKQGHSGSTGGSRLMSAGSCQHPSRPLQARAASQCPTAQAILPSPL